MKKYISVNSFLLRIVVTEKNVLCYCRWICSRSYNMKFFCESMWWGAHWFAKQFFDNIHWHHNQKYQNVKSLGWQRFFLPIFQPTVPDLTQNLLAVHVSHEFFQGGKSQKSYFHKNKDRHRLNLAKFRPTFPTWKGHFFAFKIVLKTERDSWQNSIRLKVTFFSRCAHQMLKLLCKITPSELFSYT